MIQQLLNQDQIQSQYLILNLQEMKAMKVRIMKCHYQAKTLVMHKILQKLRSPLILVQLNSQNQTRGLTLKKVKLYLARKPRKIKVF